MECISFIAKWFSSAIFLAVHILWESLIIEKFQCFLQQKFCLWECSWHSYPSDVMSAVWFPSVLAVLEPLFQFALYFPACPLFLDRFLSPPKWTVCLIKTYVTGKDNTNSLKSTYTSFSNDHRLLSFLETSWFLDADSDSFAGGHGWKDAWEPWRASCCWPPALTSSPGWSSWKYGSCEPPFLHPDVLNSPTFLYILSCG